MLAPRLIRSPYDLGLRSARSLATELGSANRTTALVADGTLRRVHRGWYISQRRWDRLSADDQSLAQLYARRLNRKTTRPLIGPSAAVLHGLFFMGKPDDTVWIGCADKSDLLGARDTVRYRLRALPNRAAGHVHGIPITDPTETLLDCALMLPRRAALVLGDQLVKLGVDLPVLEEFAGRHRPRRGVRNLRTVLERLDPLCESAGETLTRDLLIEWGIEAPVSQYAIPTPSGDYRADFAWPHLRVILEFDGHLKYDGATPATDVVMKERLRERALRDLGWLVLRTDWAEVINGSLTLKHRVETALRRRIDSIKRAN